MRACEASVVTVDDCSMCSSGASTATLRAKETKPWNDVRVMQCSYCSAHVSVHCSTNIWTELLACLRGKRLICINLKHYSNVVAVGVHQADLPRIIPRQSVGDAVATDLDRPT